MQQLIKDVEAQYLKEKAPEFQVGDSVRVKVLIREGKKERAQAFEGIVIAFGGDGINKTFTVRKIFQGIAVERTFLLHSPKVESIKVIRKGKARRAKLYFLRGRIGTKATRLREDTARIARDAAAAAASKEEAKKAKAAAKKKSAKKEEAKEEAADNKSE